MNRSIMSITAFIVAVQEVGRTVLGGMLSDDEITAEYNSDAARDFKPHIVNPAITEFNTDRNLYKR